VGSADLPDQPDEVGRVERARDASAARPQIREMPDSEERGRVYEATRAYVSAETAGRAGPGRQPDATEQGSYWDEVPRLREMWTDHERRWPERQATAEPDRSADPAGTYCSKGGFKLGPERHAETIEAISRMRETEPSISADMQAVQKENTWGGRLAGFDRRIKGDDRLKEKVAEQAAAEPDKSSSAILRKVPDPLRFTSCFEPDNYVRGYYDMKARLEDVGHEMYQSTNYWGDPEYKGINTRWVTQQGQRFEVQLHTPESFHAKQYVTHEAYERLRRPQTTDEERRELEDFQCEVSSHIQVPDGAADIPDFKKKGF
jgi:hypothetical protein